MKTAVTYAVYMEKVDALNGESIEKIKALALDPGGISPLRMAAIEAGLKNKALSARDLTVLLGAKSKLVAPFGPTAQLLCVIELARKCPGVWGETEIKAFALDAGWEIPDDQIQKAISCVRILSKQYGANP